MPNVFLGDCENGYGIFEYENVKKYKGNWKNGKHEGNGKIYDKNGKTIKEGTYYITAGTKYLALFPLTLNHYDSSFMLNLLTSPIWFYIQKYQ